MRWKFEEKHTHQSIVAHLVSSFIFTYLLRKKSSMLCSSVTRQTKKQRHDYHRAVRPAWTVNLVEFRVHRVSFRAIDWKERAMFRLCLDWPLRLCPETNRAIGKHCHARCAVSSIQFTYRRHDDWFRNERRHTQKRSVLPRSRHSITSWSTWPCSNRSRPISATARHIASVNDNLLIDRFSLSFFWDGVSGSVFSWRSKKSPVLFISIHLRTGNSYLRRETSNCWTVYNHCCSLGARRRICGRREGRSCPSRVWLRRSKTKMRIQFIRHTFDNQWRAIRLFIRRIVWISYVTLQAKVNICCSNNFPGWLESVERTKTDEEDFDQSIFRMLADGNLLWFDLHRTNREKK